jgi:hypothetical protein
MLRFCIRPSNARDHIGKENPMRIPASNFFGNRLFACIATRLARKPSFVSYLSASFQLPDRTGDYILNQ